MGLISWLARKLNGKAVPVSGPEVSALIDEYMGDICIREMAFWSAVNVIANAVSKNV